MLQSGVQACYIGAVTCSTTRRAPSSPHLACGLNVSLFLRPYTQSTPVLCGAACTNTWPNKPANPCENREILGGGSGKGLVFENGGSFGLQIPCLLGLRPNFWGLVMVRFKVINL